MSILYVTVTSLKEWYFLLSSGPTLLATTFRAVCSTTN